MQNALTFLFYIFTLGILGGHRWGSNYIVSFLIIIVDIILLLSTWLYSFSWVFLLTYSSLHLTTYYCFTFWAFTPVDTNNIYLLGIKWHMPFYIISITNFSLNTLFLMISILHRISNSSNHLCRIRDEDLTSTSHLRS